MQQRATGWTRTLVSAVDVASGWCSISWVIYCRCTKLDCLIDQQFPSSISLCFYLWEIYYLFFITRCLNYSYVSHSNRCLMTVNIAVLSLPLLFGGSIWCMFDPTPCALVCTRPYLDYLNLPGIGLIGWAWIDLYGTPLAPNDLLGSFKPVVGLIPTFLSALYGTGPWDL